MKEHFLYQVPLVTTLNKQKNTTLNARGLAKEWAGGQSFS